jgi:SdrD B-like domain
MSFAHRPRLALEFLNARLVPSATVLDLTTHGAEATAPSGAIVQQLDTQPAGALHPFVSMQPGLIGGLLGGLLGNGTEQGYNTDARPVQFDESSDAQVNHALTLGQVPVVVVNGVAYREFLVTINQSSSSRNLSLDELRVFLGSTGDLSGYSTSTKKLAGQTAVFDLDAGGDVSVKMRDGMNAGSAYPDAAVLIPDAAFAGASAGTFVYVYSKFGGLAGAGANGGFEEWSVRDVPPPPPATASLAGSLFVDANHNGTWDAGESGLAGVTITLQGFDYLGNAVSLETQTNADGTYVFSNVLAGTYTLAEQPQFGYASEFAAAGSDGGDASPGQVTNIHLGAGDTATGYLFGDVYSE